MRHRTGISTIRMLVAAGVVGGTVALSAGPAVAACHAFTVEVEPATIREGGIVTITVRRDAAVAPSQVDVSTVDEDAIAGEDYEGLEETVSFTRETERTLTLSTTDDDADEGVETLLVRLSNPGGCSVNPSFVLGPDARVRIRGADAAAPSPSPEPTEEPSESPEPSPSPSLTEAASDESTGGGLPAVALAAAAAALVIIAGVVWFLRRRGA
jgi:hypothetical protein